MKKSTIITTTLLTLVAGVACAQSTPQGFTLRGGYSYLANKDSRDATNTSGYTVGLSYDLPSMDKYATNGGKISLDIDYNAQSGNSNKMYTAAYQLAYRTSASHGRRMKGGNQPYFGLSAGYFQNHYDILSVTGTKGVFGGGVMVGMDLSQQAGIELSYRFSGTVDGVNFDTLNAAVTVHF